MDSFFRLQSFTSLLFFAAAMIVGQAALGQVSHAGFGPGQEIDVALTYTATHSNQTNGPTFWPQGGALSVNAQFAKGFGLMASGTGLHASGDGGTAGLDLVTVVFGPSYTVRFGKRISVFGEALAGEAHGLHSVFSYFSGVLPSLVVGTADSADSLAFQAGGGVDLHVSRRFAVRPIEVEYLRTQLPNGGTNVQDNVRIAAGLVATFGRTHDQR